MGKDDERGVMNLTGGAHPGAEHGAVRRCLVMAVMTLMLDRLSRRDPADPENAED